MSNDQIPPRVQQLIDRQDILDCLMRYSRAVDRFDIDMIRSVYHPDATDDHGAFVGNPEQFIEWVVEWSGTINEGPIPFAEIPDVHTNGVPGRNKDDPSYRRPLTNKRAARFLMGMH